MKTILFLLTMMLATLTACAQTNKISQLPVATVIFSNDVILINATNPASPTGFTSKTISVANFNASLNTFNTANGSAALPLLSFISIFGGTSLMQSPSPNVTPAIRLAYTNGSVAYDFPIPNYVTNATVNFRLLWQGASSLSITSQFNAYYNTPAGRISPSTGSTIFTLNPLSETWVSYPNTYWADTNFSKWFEIIISPPATNSGSLQVWLTSAYYTAKNNVFRSTNF